MMVKTKALKSCILAGTTFLCLSVTALAQQPGDLGYRKELYENLFIFPHWEVMFAPNVNAKAQLKHLQEAKYQLMTNPQISYEFGIRRIGQLNTQMGFILGFHFGLVGRNAAYIVPGEEIGLTDFGEYPFTGPIARERDISFFAIPAEIEYRIFTHKKYMYLLNGGVSLRYAPLNNTSFADMEVMEVNLSGNKNPFINVNIGGGVGIVLKNLDMIKVGLKLNYDPSYIAKGNFRLDTNSSSDAGIYKVRGNSIGIALRYTRTKSLSSY
jgi:hypothetical protein